MNMLYRFIHNEDGANAIEYGLLTALIALVVVGAIGTVGTNMGTMYTQVQTAVTR